MRILLVSEIKKIKMEHAWSPLKQKYAKSRNPSLYNNIHI